MKYTKDDYEYGILRKFLYHTSENQIVAMDKILSSGRIDINDYIEHEGDALCIASNNKDYDTCKWLLEHGANPSGNGEESNPISHAGYGPNGNLELVKLLVESGADINKQNSVGYTAIFYSSKTNIWEYLIKNGANLEVKHKGKIETPLIDENNKQLYSTYKAQKKIAEYTPHQFPILIKYGYKIKERLKREYDYLLDSDELGLL